MLCRKLKVGNKNILKELSIAFERPISVNAMLKESDKRLKRLKVPMKRNFFSHICEIFRLKYTIPKFEMFRVKITDFTRLQSCAILPSKMVFELRGQNTT